MPVGKPELVQLTQAEFDHFFGFLWAKVRAPADLYVGLLPIKYQGQLVCPGGTFTGLFFSEELRFALENGYQLLELGQACRFERGEETFRGLIKELNEMKVEAQLAGEPVRRSIAKLLMNALYGRFGMHPNEGIGALVTLAEFNELVEGNTIVSQVRIGDRFLVEYLPKAPEGVINLGAKVKRAPKPRPMATCVPIGRYCRRYGDICLLAYLLSLILVLLLTLASLLNSSLSPCYIMFLYNRGCPPHLSSLYIVFHNS